MANYTYINGSSRLGSFEGYGVSRLGDQTLGNFGAGPPNTGYLVPIENTFGWMKSQGLESEIAGLAPLRGAKIANFLAALPTGQGTYDLIRQNTQDMFLRGISGQKQEVSGLNVVVFSPAGGGRAPAESSGPNAGEVLTGVGSILGALGGPLASIFSAHTQANLAKQQLKFGQNQPQPQQYQQSYPQPQPQQGGSNTILIVVVLAVVAIGAIFMMTR